MPPGTGLKAAQGLLYPCSFAACRRLPAAQDPGAGGRGTWLTTRSLCRDVGGKSPVVYADGINAPSTPNTINPRVISNNLSNQSDPIFSFNNNLGNPN
jgi:hypothetical protein